MSCHFAYADILGGVDFGSDQNNRFMVALTLFFVISIGFVIWMIIQRLGILKKLERAKSNEKYLNKIILKREGGFFLWDADGNPVMNSVIDICFEDETTPKDLDDLRSRFPARDQTLFDENLQKLLSGGAEFSQVIDMEQFNMHLQVSGSCFGEKGSDERCYAIWVRDDTVSQKIKRYQTLETKVRNERAQLLENALNNANFPIWIRGDNLDLLWVNNAYVEAVDGKACQNVIENNLELDVNTLGVSVRGIAEAASLRGEPSSESHFVVINGERRSMDFHNIPYKLNDHREAILGYAQDITELEEARGNLADHTESYAETLDQFSSAVAIFDSGLRLEYYNKSYVRLWGLPESLLFSHPHYGEVLEALREARKLPEQANFPEWKKKQLEMCAQVLDPTESMMHLPDGKTLRVVMQQHPLGGMLVFYEDVTDYFALESSYNTLIAVQRETLDNLQEGIAVFGVDGRLKLFNDGFVNIWEVSHDFLNTDPRAKDVLDRCGRLFESEETIAEFQKLIVGGEVKKEAASGQFKLKNEKVINYSLVPLPDGAVLIIFIDVTDSYRVEYSLRKHNEALEEAQNIKTDFLAHMSYELRNPLNSVLGFAELLEKEYQGPLNEEQHQYMRNILSASDHLLDLINDILDLSVIEAGGLYIETSDFDIREIIKNVVLKHDERIRQKAIKLDINLDKNLDVVHGDARRIQHSISNLISNAIKFTNEAGHIEVSTWQDDENYFISVRDDGIGIDQNECEEIFDKFYTGSNVPKGKGAGLGLSLVKIFIEKHGGSVMVKSTLGIGTEMSCQLPKKIPDLNNLSDLAINKNEVVSE